MHLLKLVCPVPPQWLTASELGGPLAGSVEGTGCLHRWRSAPMHWARITRHSLRSWPSPLSCIYLPSWSSNSLVSSKGDTWLCWALLPTPPEKAEMTTTLLSDNLVTGEHLPTKWMTISQFPLLSMITIQAFLHPPTYTLRLSLFLLRICLPVWAQLSFCHPQSWWLGNINHNEKCGFECLQAERSIRSRCFPMLSKNASHYAYSQWQAEVPPIRVTFLCWQLHCFVVNSELCIQAKTGWKCGFQVSSC